MVANKEVERNLLKLKQLRFEWADKSGKYLAWQLKKKRGKSDKCDQRGKQTNCGQERS